MYITKLFSLFIILISTSLSIGDNNINGKWIQADSNRYVQETSEIGWNCVTVNLTKNGDQLSITKSAIQNNNNVSSDMTLFPVLDKPNLYVDNINNVYYEIRYNDSNSLLWTTDDGATYIWVRDYIEFKTNDEWNLLNKFEIWGFTGYLHFPIPSYDLTCISSKKQKYLRGL